MASRRTAKIASAILEAVSSTVLHGLKDPRVKNVTVIHVEVSDDVRSAKVYVSVMGDEKVQALSMRGLKAARGFLQSKVADRLQTKHTPILTFILDPSVKRSLASSALIRQALEDGTEGANHLAGSPSAAESAEQEDVESPQDSEQELGETLTEDPDDID